MSLFFAFFAAFRELCDLGFCLIMEMKALTQARRDLAKFAKKTSTNDLGSYLACRKRRVWETGIEARPAGQGQATARVPIP